MCCVDTKYEAVLGKFEWMKIKQRIFRMVGFGGKVGRSTQPFWNANEQPEQANGSSQFHY
jgi:hypothetical protein